MKMEIRKRAKERMKRTIQARWKREERQGARENETEALFAA